jgi:hypothetical protein
MTCAIGSPPTSFSPPPTSRSDHGDATSISTISVDEFGINAPFRDHSQKVYDRMSPEPFEGRPARPSHSDAGPII